MENVLELTHLKKYYGQTRAVEDVSFSVKPGEVVVIIGPSGAGKSTVLRCINRMIDPTEGTILFQGTDMAQVKRERDLKAIRRRIGMIFPILQSCLPPFRVPERAPRAAGLYVHPQRRSGPLL